MIRIDRRHMTFETFASKLGGNGLDGDTTVHALRDKTNGYLSKVGALLLYRTAGPQCPPSSMGVLHLSDKSDAVRRISRIPEVHYFGECV